MRTIELGPNDSAFVCRGSASHELILPEGVVFPEAVAALNTRIEQLEQMLDDAHQVRRGEMAQLKAQPAALQRVPTAEDVRAFVGHDFGTGRT